MNLFVASFMDPVLDTISNIFRPLIELFGWLLNQLHAIGLSWGLAIVALTVIVRIPLIWPSLKQYRSMNAMKQLQPHIKELQKKHKGDRARIQQEQMRLYSENKINPVLGSCLPILPTMIVMSGLFYTIRGADELKTASFLWIDQLGARPGYLLLALYLISQFFMSLVTMNQNPNQDRNQKIMMIGMPMVFVFMLKSLPAGLFVYWITSNLLGVAQMQMFVKFVPLSTDVAIPPPLGKGAADAAKTTGKKQGFMERMVAAQEERDARQAAEKKAKGGSGGKPGKKQSGASGKKQSGKPGGKPAGTSTSRPRKGKSGGSKPPDALG